MIAARLRAGLAVLAAFMLYFPWNAVHAVGTPAGTSISGTATATYSIAGKPAPPISSTAVFRVDELISVRVTAPVTATAVNSPDLNRALVFTVTNVGNGPESFTLTPNLNPAVADQFNPAPGSLGQLFLDVNGNGQLEPGTDTPINAPITLAADQAVRVLLVSNIPVSLNNGDQGIVTLTATSTTAGAAGAAPGTILANRGTPTVGSPGIDAVVGAGPGGAADSGADDAANGSYIVSSLIVTIDKTILAVTSPFGVTTTPCNVASPPPACTVFLPGTVVQYQVMVTTTGVGTALNVQVSDNIPANTSYVANSIRFNAAARTDGVDGDNASCTGCGSAVGTVTVVVGDVPVVVGAPVTHLIDYKVIIN